MENTFNMFEIIGKILMYIKFLRTLELCDLGKDIIDAEFHEMGEKNV